MSENQNKEINILDSLRDMKREYDERQKPDIVFKPIEKPPVEEKPKEEIRPRGLLSKIRAKSLDPREVESIKEKNAIKEEYLKIYKNQQTASNTVFAEVRETIEKVFSQIMKEDESYYLDDAVLREEKEAKALVRADRRKYLENTENQLVRALSSDLVRHHAERIQILNQLTPEDIEIVRKVRFTETNIIYTTDEGEYIVDGRKAGSFGGYLSLSRNFLTETLDLTELTKSSLKESKGKNKDAQGKIWLMITPLVIPADSGKYLMMPVGYLQKALVEHIDNEKKRKDVYSALARAKKKDEVNDLKSYYERTPREIVEDLLNFKKPINRNVVFFPYKALEEFGVEVEFDVNFATTNYTDIIVEIENNSLDYMGWDKLQELGELNDLEKAIKKVITKVQILNTLKTKLEENVSDVEEKSKELDNAYYLLENPQESPKADETTIVSASDIEKDIKTLQKDIKALQKERLVLSKNLCTKAYSFNLKEVYDVVSVVRKSKYLDHNLTIRLGRVMSALNSIQSGSLGLSSIQEHLLEHLATLGYDQESGMKVISQLEERIANELQTVIPFYDKFLQDYKQRREKTERIQNAIGSAIMNPAIRNLQLNISNNSVSGLKLAPIILNNLLEVYPDMYREVENINKYPIPIISHTLTSIEYEKIRAIVKHLGDREYVHWFEILKIIALAESSLLTTTVKVYEDIQELIRIPELKKDLDRLNNSGKFIQPTPEEGKDIKFNMMFNDLVLNKKGLLCSIDYKNLAEYLVSETREYTGDELIKRIPCMSLVDKHYGILDTAVTLPQILPERLMNELPNLPAPYLALNHIMSTIQSQIGMDESLFTSKFEEMERYFKLSDSLSRVTPNRKSMEKLDNIYSEIERSRISLNSILDKLTGRLVSRYYSSNEVIDKIGEILENFPKHFGKKSEDPIENKRLMEEERQKFQDSYKNLKLNVITLEEEVSILREKIERDREDRVATLAQELKELKESINDAVGIEASGIVGKLSGYYNKSTLEGDLKSAWIFFNFDKFSKGKVLLNFILTYASDYSDITQAAIYSIIRDSLMNYRKVENALKAKGSSVVDITVSLFEYLCFELKLDRVLRITSSDRLEISNAVQDTIVGGGISKADLALVRNFMQGLQGLTDKEIRNSLRNFERKELINDELYLSIVYNDENQLEEMYPSWYSRDFSVAENLKIMLDCGIPETSLHPEHYNDKKLMNIVKNTEISPSYIEEIKRGLEP